jgi:hypothetical protein
LSGAKVVKIWISGHFKRLKITALSFTISAIIPPKDIFYRRDAIDISTGKVGCEDSCPTMDNI